ncbi:MAG: DUF2058 domain-containing protein [Cocleimonas sp.]
MAGSLQDQFLAAGLIKKQKANNIKTAKKKAVKKSRANNTELADEAGDLAKKAQDEQRSKSQALNKEKKQEAEQKSIQAQIRQIVELNSIKKAPKEMSEDDLSTYNFTSDKKIKTMHVSPQNHDLISRGKIAIALLINSGNEVFHLIPAEAASKISERDENVIVLLNDVSSESQDDDVDDPYAGFEVPDDLMW